MRDELRSPEPTSGPILRTLLALTLPLVAQNLAMVAQQVVDAFWIGRLGEDALAAVGLVIPLTALLAIPLMAVYTGVHIVTAQRVGTGDENASVPPLLGLVLSLVGSIGLFLLVYPNTETIVGLLTDSTRIQTLGAAYLGSWLFAILVSSASDSLETGFVGYGETRIAMAINLVAIGANIVLDPVFIFGYGAIPRFGIAGAAYASAVSYGIGLSIAVVVLVLGRSAFQPTVDWDILDPTLAREVLSLGWPSSAQGAGRQFARLGMVALVSFAAGPVGLAAYTIGARVSTIAFVPALGLAQAATTMVGQNVGAGEPVRAHKTTRTGVIGGAIVLSVLGIVQFVMPAEIARLLVPTISTEALGLATFYLQLLALCYWAFPVIYVVEAGFDGARRTKVAMYGTIAQYWLVRLPIAATGVVFLGFGASAVFAAVVLSNIIAALALVAYYRNEHANGLYERAVEQAAAD